MKNCPTAKNPHTKIKFTKAKKKVKFKLACQQLWVWTTANSQGRSSLPFLR